MYSLDHYLYKRDSEKSSKYHNFSRQYENTFSSYRGKNNIKILEFGYKVHNVINNIEAYSEYFTNPQYIVGINISDIEPEFKNTDKIFLEKLSSDNKIDNIINRYGVFDIIIDNGCYYYDGIFESLFPCMKDDGIYIVNKIKTEYFNKYIKYLNTSDDIDFIKDPYKINKTTENVFEKTIDKIEFGCGFIIIHKKNRDHWQLVKQ